MFGYIGIAVGDPNKMCVVSLIGCEPVDILVVWLYRYCRWRSNYKGWGGMQFTGLSPPYFHTCSKPGPEFQRHMSLSVCCVFHLFIVPHNRMFVGILFSLKHGFYKKLLSCLYFVNTYNTVHIINNFLLCFFLEIM